MNRTAWKIPAAALLLTVATFAPAQQTSPSAPAPGTVPITSQTPVRPAQDPTAPTTAAAPMSASDHQRHKARKHAKKVARKSAKAAKKNPPQ